MKDNKIEETILTKKDLPAVEEATSGLINYLTQFVLNNVQSKKLPSICITSLINALYHVMNVFNISKELTIAFVEEIWDKQEELKLEAKLTSNPSKTKELN